MPPMMEPAAGGMGGAGAPPAPPPFGTSGATGPTPNLGYEAAGLQKLGVVVKQLEQLIPILGATTEPGKACLDALNKLAKWIPPGSVTPAAERNQLEQTMMTNIANNQQMQALRQSRPGMEPPPPAGMPRMAMQP